MSLYESEFTLWMRELKAARPHLDQTQQEGRAIWWDHPQDLDTQQRNKASALPQPSYVYFSPAK